MPFAFSSMLTIKRYTQRSDYPECDNDHRCTTLNECLPAQREKPALPCAPLRCRSDKGKRRCEEHDLPFSRPRKGYAGLGDYAAIGEGRSVALIAPDGAIDWWCAPNLDSPPLFDRILDASNGGYFQVAPTAPWRMQRHYRENSNVLETRYQTDSGEVLITESLNSTGGTIAVE